MRTESTFGPMDPDDYERTMRARTRRLRLLQIAVFSVVVLALVGWRLARIGSVASKLATADDPSGFVGLTQSERLRLQGGGKTGISILETADKLEMIVTTFGESGAAGRCTPELREKDQALIERANVEGGENAAGATKLAAALDRFCGP